MSHGPVAGSAPSALANALKSAGIVLNISQNDAERGSQSRSASVRSASASAVPVIVAVPGGFPHSIAIAIAGDPTYGADILSQPGAYNTFPVTAGPHTPLLSIAPTNGSVSNT